VPEFPGTAVDAAAVGAGGRTGAIPDVSRKGTRSAALAKRSSPSPFSTPYGAPPEQGSPDDETDAAARSKARKRMG